MIESEARPPGLFTGPYAVPAALGVTAAVFVVTTLGGSFLGRLLANAVGLDDLDQETSSLGIDVVGTIAVVIVLTRLGWWRAVGFGPPSTWRDRRLLVVPAAVAVLALLGGLSGIEFDDPARVGLVIMQPLLTGFWEEGLIRGFLLFALLGAAVRAGAGPIWSVVVSAVIFGALHLIALVGGADPASVLSQVVFATFFGIGFGAVLIRTNALWALVLIHALFNIAPVLNPEEASGFQLGAIVITAPLALYGLFLLRPVKSEPSSASGAVNRREAP